VPQLLTTAGDVADIPTIPRARAYPLSGIDTGRIQLGGAQAIPLSRLPSGETRMLAISRVYRTNPVIFACVHLIARGLSSIPIRTYTVDSSGERRRIRGDVPPAGPGRPPAGVLLDNLMRQPAPRISRRKLVFKTTLDTAIFGNALQVFNWGPYGPSELWPVPWRRVRVNSNDPMQAIGYTVSGVSGSKTFAPEEVIHYSWGDDPESVVGVSPIEALQYTIALHNAIDRHLVSFYGNAARPSGILKLQNMPKPGDVDAIREQFRQLYTAPESAGNVVITSAEYQPIAEATGVPTLVELIKLSREEIFGVYGVDPPMVGIFDNAIKANVFEARGKFVRDTLGPWATLHEDEMWAQMISQNPLWNYHWCEFDLDERLRPDLKDRATTYAAMGTTLTVNERRRKENLPDLPFPEADTVWMGSGTIPLGFGVPTTTSDLTPETEPVPELEPAPEGEEDAGDIGADPDAEQEGN
jgi:HK97 family phage portal protein